MTIKELSKVMGADTTFAILIGADQEVVAGKEDKALLEALGDIVIDRAIANGLDGLTIYAKTVVVKEATV